MNKINDFIFFDNQLVVAECVNNLLLFNKPIVFYGACSFVKSLNQVEIGFVSGFYDQNKQLQILIISSKNLIPSTKEPINWCDEIKDFIKNYGIRTQINNNQIRNSSVLLKISEELIRLRSLKFNNSFSEISSI
jgi:hypothetical protein